MRGIQKMVEDDRYCADVLIQISAVHEALRGVGREVMRNHLKHCATAAMKGTEAECERDARRDPGPHVQARAIAEDAKAPKTACTALAAAPDRRSERVTFIDSKFASPTDQQMTKTKTPSALAADDLDVDSLMDTFRARRREIAIGAVVFAAWPGGFFCGAYRSTRNSNAPSGADAGDEHLLHGNRPLAATELQALTDRYSDTPAGVEGAMVLAQMEFEEARWADWSEGARGHPAVGGDRRVPGAGGRPDGRRLRRPQEVRRRREDYQARGDERSTRR